MRLPTFQSQQGTSMGSAMTTPAQVGAIKPRIAEVRPLTAVRDVQGELNLGLRKSEMALQIGQSVAEIADVSLRIHDANQATAQKAANSERTSQMAAYAVQLQIDGDQIDEATGKRNWEIAPEKMAEYSKALDGSLEEKYGITNSRYKQAYSINAKAEDSVYQNKTKIWQNDKYVVQSQAYGKLAIANARSPREAREAAATLQSKGVFYDYEIEPMIKDFDAKFHYQESIRVMADMSSEQLITMQKEIINGDEKYKVMSIEAQNRLLGGAQQENINDMVTGLQKSGDVTAKRTEIARLDECGMECTNTISREEHDDVIQYMTAVTNREANRETALATQSAAADNLLTNVGMGQIDEIMTQMVAPTTMEQRILDANTLVDELKDRKKFPVGSHGIKSEKDRNAKIKLLREHIDTIHSDIERGVLTDDTLAFERDKRITDATTNARASVFSDLESFMFSDNISFEQAYQEAALNVASMYKMSPAQLGVVTEDEKLELITGIKKDLDARYNGMKATREDPAKRDALKTKIEGDLIEATGQNAFDFFNKYPSLIEESHQAAKDNILVEGYSEDLQHRLLSRVDRVYNDWMKAHDERLEAAKTDQLLKAAFGGADAQGDVVTAFITGNDAKDNRDRLDKWTSDYLAETNNVIDGRLMAMTVSMAEVGYVQKPIADLLNRNIGSGTPAKMLESLQVVDVIDKSNPYSLSLTPESQNKLTMFRDVEYSNLISPSDKDYPQKFAKMYNEQATMGDQEVSVRNELGRNWWAEMSFTKELEERALYHADMEGGLFGSEVDVSENSEFATAIEMSFHKNMRYTTNPDIAFSQAYSQTRKDFGFESRTDGYGAMRPDRNIPESNPIYWAGNRRATAEYVSDQVEDEFDETNIKRKAGGKKSLNMEDTMLIQAPDDPNAYLVYSKIGFVHENENGKPLTYKLKPYATHKAERDNIDTQQAGFVEAETKMNDVFNTMSQYKLEAINNVYFRASPKTAFGIWSDEMTIHELKDRSEKEWGQTWARSQEVESKQWSDAYKLSMKAYNDYDKNANADTTPSRKRNEIELWLFGNGYRRAAITGEPSTENGLYLPVGIR